MVTLPTVLSMLPDELLYSYLFRLQKANGFTNLRGLMNSFIAPYDTDSERRRRIPEYSLLRDFESICRVTMKEQNKQQLFLSSGLFPFYRLFLTKDQQCMIINQAFDNNRNDSLIEASTAKMMSKVHYCPECMKEDSAKYNGEFYLHRCHQISEVVVCPEHGCLLETYAGGQLHEMDEKPKTVTEKPVKDADCYARYCRDLINADIDAGSEELKAAIIKELTVRYSDNQTAAFDAFSKEAPLQLTRKKFKDTWGDIHSDRYLGIPSSIAMLSWLFPETKDLKAVIGDPVMPDSFQDALIKNNCTLEGSYSRTLVTLRHECGAVFCIQPDEFASSWQCPSCGQKLYTAPKTPVVAERTEATFKKEIADLTGDEYSLDGPYRDMKHRVRIKHQVCGHVQEYLPANFLDGFRCSECTPVLGKEHYDQSIREISDGRYRILATRSHVLCTIEDTQTGRHLDIYPRKALAELKRPTPSSILPLESKKTVSSLPTTKVGEFQKWIEKAFPRGEPVFLDGIDPEKAEPEPLTYKVLKARFSSLQRKGILTNPAPGVYFYAGEDFPPSQTAWFRYVCTRGDHIGYPTGDNAMYYLGIIPDQPDDIRVATNKETSNNTVGRTTTFMGKKLRIKGSVFPITNDNWKVLMVLDLLTNIKKFMKGQDTEKALQVIALYVRNSGIKREDFSLYQNKYSFAEPAIRDLFRRIQEMR